VAQTHYCMITSWSLRFGRRGESVSLWRRSL